MYIIVKILETGNSFGWHTASNTIPLPNEVFTYVRDGGEEKYQIRSREFIYYKQTNEETVTLHCWRIA